METKFNSDERRRIQQGIKEKYKLVAINPEGKFRYPTGRAGLQGQNYDKEFFNQVSFSSCNPFDLTCLHLTGSLKIIMSRHVSGL